MAAHSEREKLPPEDATFQYSSANFMHYYVFCETVLHLIWSKEMQTKEHRQLLSTIRWGFLGGFFGFFIFMAQTSALNFSPLTLAKMKSATFPLVMSNESINSDMLSFLKVYVDSTWSQIIGSHSCNTCIQLSKTTLSCNLPLFLKEAKRKPGGT